MLSSGRSLLSPFGLASPALASSCAVRCPAGMVGRGKPCAALSDGWLNAPTNFHKSPRLISAPNHARRAADSAAGRKGWRSQTEGEKGRSARAELAPDRAIQVFPCHGVSSANVASQFYSIDFYVTHRFFGTFLVRPALLPYGKRGFLAAIYKIARPQPPAAALWLQESTVPPRPPVSPRTIKKQKVIFAC